MNSEDIKLHKIYNITCGRSRWKEFDAWSSFDKFKTWSIEMGWQEGYWMVKYDKEDEWCPDNVEFISASTRRLRCKDVIEITTKDGTYKMPYLAKKHGLSTAILCYRLGKGMGVEEALNKDKRKYVKKVIDK